MIFSVREDDNSDFGTTTSKPAYDFTRFTTSLLRINRDGKVGIGTTSPQQKLDVIGRVRATHNTSNYYEIGASSAGGFVVGKSGGVETVNIRTYGDSHFNGGNVGIGTTSPGAKLHIDVVSEDNQPGFKLTKVSDSGENAMEVHHGTSSALRGIADFTNSNGSVLFLRGDGNVGIGTTSPLELFHVHSGDSGGTANIAADEILVEGSGDTGITISSPSANIGSLAFGDDSVSLRGALRYDHSDDSMSFRVSSSEKMRISSTLHVGIGNTNPTYKLSVNGGISAGGKVTYTKSAGSLDTTGYAVAGLTTSSNGQSAGFTFTCFGHTGGYQKIVYSCYNASGTWNTVKVIDEGTNQLDIEASANGTTITFTFKSRSGTMSYTPRVTVEATGTAINNTYA